jgi:hypothetical protein
MVGYKTPARRVVVVSVSHSADSRSPLCRLTLLDQLDVQAQFNPQYNRVTGNDTDVQRRNQSYSRRSAADPGPTGLCAPACDHARQSDGGSNRASDGTSPDCENTNVDYLTLRALVPLSLA